MAYYNTNSGALFINERRQKDSQPNYTGTINVDGVEYWVSGWEKVSQTSGKHFLSLALKPKDEQAIPKTGYF